MVNDNIILIAPAHNEEKLLEIRTKEVIEAAKTRPLDLFIIAENGSTDNTFQIIPQLLGQYGRLQIDSVHCPRGDYGEATAIAMDKILKTTDHEDSWFLISAADLPFRMSDVDHFLSLKDKLIPSMILLGSKRHPESQIERPFLRTTLSFFYQILRFIFLGLEVKDTQGTVFIPVRLARKILPQIKSRGFFFTTELIYRCKKENIKILEIPVCLRSEDRPTKVKWFKISMKMAFHILKLRFERNESN